MNEKSRTRRKLEMSGLMKDFPPREGHQVTLANWRLAPFNQWAFHHVREIVPTASIDNEPSAVSALDHAPRDLSGITIEGHDGNVSLSKFLEKTDTDALVVLHKGKLVYEIYRHGMTAATPHILMSVSKSVLGIITGIAIADGALSEDDPVERHLPEMAKTGFAGASVRDLLDMRVGVTFDENYLTTTGPIIDYRKATNWNPLQSGDTVSDLRSFFSTLKQTDGPHNGDFHYISPNSDLLGWVIERATGERFSDYMSRVLWQPMGAEYPAYLTVDRLCAPRTAGGICTTARDLARLGRLLTGDGHRDGRQIIPPSWIIDIQDNGDTPAWNNGNFADMFPNLPMHYRSKCYVVRGDTPMIFGLGIHGQYLFVDRAREVVIAKMSSQDIPLDPANVRKELQAAQAITQYLDPQ